MSAQRRSGRKRAANTRINDLPETSPSQRPRPAAKRRKVSDAPHTSSRSQALNASKPNQPPRNRQPRRPKTPDNDEEIANNETEEEEEEDVEFEELTPEEQNRELIESVARCLDVAKYEVNAAELYKPEKWGNETREAYAQISGREWTYFVNTISINIGRPAEEAKEEDVQNQQVDIDLGPSKVVSRKHAAIFFNQETGDWHIAVEGRNGVRVNGDQLKKGGSRKIGSGDIIAIGETQMLFHLPNEKIRISPWLSEKTGLPQDQSSDTATLIGSPALHRSAYQSNVPSDNIDPKQNGQLPQNITPAVSDTRPKTPDPVQKREPTTSGKKRSPYKRGMMMESTEQIDYSLDSSRDIKPSYSYAAMITYAILSTPDEALTLNGIYEWIKRHYAFYRLTPSGWQNSIRHNLSLNSSFHKIPRRADEPGKGMKWTFVPEARESTIAAAQKNMSKSGGRTLSAPGSPADVPDQSSFTLPAPVQSVKASPTQRTPPLSSYPPQQHETPTPSRESFHEPQMPVYAPTQGQLPVLSDENSPAPRRFTNSHLTMTGSSPILTSGYGISGLPMHTPAPRAFNLPAPQPNTASNPTSHMTPTTPAPFWKLPSTGLGSTPARWPDSSPVKHDDNVQLPSSSPPPMNGFESPTRKGGSSQQPSVSRSSFGPPTQNGNVAPSRGGEMSSSSNAPAPPQEDGGGGIDLLKGFTKISTYHQPSRNSLPSAQAQAQAQAH